jgi:hypothetical protein
MRARLAAVLLPAAAMLAVAAAPAQAATGDLLPVARTFTGIAQLGQTAADAYHLAQTNMVTQGFDEGLLCVERSHVEYRIAFSGHWVSNVQAECTTTTSLA